MRSVSTFFTAFCLIAALLLIGYAPEIRAMVERLDAQNITLAVRAR